MDESWHQLLVLSPTVLESLRGDGPWWTLVDPQGTIGARAPYHQADTPMDAVRRLQADGALPAGFATATAEPLRQRPVLEDPSASLHPHHPQVRYHVHLRHTSVPPENTTTVALPQLRLDRGPLAFLAALGTLVLLDESTDLNPRLSWSTETGTAHISAPGLTLPLLHQHLVDCLERMRAQDQLLPGVDGFPPQPKGSGGDPLRVPINQAPDLFTRVEADHGPGALAWLERIVNPHAPDNRGRAALTPFMAPRGRQSVYSFFAFPLRDVAEDPSTLLWQALTWWHRVEGCTGENLDHGAPVGAVDTPRGEAYSEGVPGATWLAVQALALTEVHRSPAATGPATLWHHLPGLQVPRHTQQVLVCPLWSEPLPRSEVEELLREPGYSVRSNDPQGSQRPQWPQWQPIWVDFAPTPPWKGRWSQARQRGVFTVTAALRPVLDKSLGPLTPTEVLITDEQTPHQAGFDVNKTPRTPTPQALRKDASRLFVYASADHHWLGTRHEGWWDAFNQVWVLPVPRRYTRLNRLLAELEATRLTYRAAPSPVEQARPKKTRAKKAGAATDNASDQGRARAPVPEVAAQGLITHHQMQQMLACCSEHTPEGVRDRALILACWELMATASALQALDVDHLIPHPNGFEAQVAGRRVALPRRAQEQVCPVRALNAYLDLRQTEQDRLVRGPLWLHAAPRSSAAAFTPEPLSTSEVSARVNRIAREAGLTGTQTATGLRHGAIVAAAAMGAPAPWLAARSGMSAGSATLRDLVALGRAAAEPATAEPWASDPWTWQWP